MYSINESSLKTYGYLADTRTPKLTSIGIVADKAEDAFDYDNDSLRQETVDVINRVAEWFIRNEIDRVDIYGFADTVGVESYNKILSGRRAENVAIYFNEKGITQVRAFGRGEDKPLYDKWGRIDYQRSRRVEICFEK